MNHDWDNEDDFGMFNIKELEFVPSDWCSHNWKPTLLIFSTVYDCVKCGKKKEDHDKQI